MKKYLLPFLVLLALLCSNQIASARTGSFDTTITFMSAPRILSIYVPPTYNPATKYRLMIGLHGLGDNSANYRNGLINSLGWATNMPNTIFIFPEASATTADFYQTVGAEAIIDTCIRIAMTQYHIDTANVILQGFSLGGRAALRYGLDHYAKFKGLLLNTPAIQGVKNALNQQPNYQYNYANASRIPIYITHGMTDILYEPPIDTAIQQMILNDGMVRYNNVPGIGHTIPATKKIIEFLSFFDQPARTGSSLDLVRIFAPLRTCHSQPTPTLLVQNTGSVPIRLAELVYTLYGIVDSVRTVDSFRITDRTLAPFQHSVILLGLNESEGLNVLQVRISTLNGTTPDTATPNNIQIDTFQVESLGLPLPITEGFEGNTFPPAGWALEQAGDAYSPWSVDNTVAKTGNNSVGAFNTILVFDNLGRAEGLLSPALDLTSIAHPSVSFDLAYNYHQYTPPYFTQTVNFADTLEVLISTDCLGTFTSLFKRGGADLATFADPILNPLSVAADFIAPADTNWKRISIDLSNYSTANAATVKFNYISALGGSIYIDNVSFAGPASVTAPVAAAYRPYPNPATSSVTIGATPNTMTKVTVLDVTGRQQFATDGQTNATGELSIDTHTLRDGVYLLQISSANDMRTEKLVIRH